MSSRLNLNVNYDNPMMTSSNGNIFRVTGICAGNSPATGEFPSQRPVTRSFNALAPKNMDYFFLFLRFLLLFVGCAGVSVFEIHPFR